jgi:hypothetical protein
MGGTVLLGSEWTAWNGGVPKPDWSGLKDDTQSFTNPNMLRPSSAAAAQKGYNTRKEGLKEKFKRGGDLVSFKHYICEHLKDTGQDSISYLKNPADSSHMMHVVKDHARFTVATGKKLSQEQIKLYDSYDRANDASARKFLLASIASPLSSQILERLDDDSTFTDVWLEFIKSIQSTSVERFEDIRNKIKARLPSQYPGENIESMASDFRRDARELIDAGQYDHNLTLNMTKQFLLAGGDMNENYKSEIRTMSKALGKALLLIAHMDKEAADKYMRDHDFTYMDSCRVAEGEYRSQFDTFEWPPARHARDSKAVPSNFGANALYPSTPPGGAGGFKETRLCYNCGTPGHLSRDCTSPKKDKGRSPNGHRPPADSRPPRTNQNRSPSLWKTTPPAAGADETKVVNGKRFFWCNKCKRYSTTHTTDEHTGKRDKAGTAAANYSLVPDAAAWHVNFGMDTLASDLWEMFAPSLVSIFLLLIGFFLGTFPVMLVFRAFGSFLWQHSWSLLAPLLWLFMLMSPYLLRPAIDNYFDPSPRSYRRQHGRLRDRENSRWNRSRNYSGSIRHHGLHRRYPISLRSLGHFITGTPTLKDQELQHQVSLLRNQVQRLIRTVESLRTPHAHTRTVPCRNSPASRPMRNHAAYQPIPANGHHNLGNTRLTHKQARAAHKMSMHCNMARVNLGYEPAGDAATLRMALNAPHCFRQALLKIKALLIIWDSGASISVSYDRADFVGELKPAGVMTRLQGIAKGLRIEGQGHVLWPMLDTMGHYRLIKVPAFYVPKSNVRLLSTTSLLQTYAGETIEVDAGQMQLSGLPSDPNRGAVIATVNPRNNLPMTTSYPYDVVREIPQALSAAINMTNEANTNLSAPEKELLRWHARLGHLDCRKIQFLMRTGVLSRSESTRRLHVAAAKLSHPPKCAACQFGKQSQRPSPGQKTSAVKDRAGVLKTDHLFPGQCVSVDHFVCATKGRLFTSRGKTHENDMYDGGCLFIDHATNHVHIEFQTHLNSHETLRAKGAYERMCRDYGVVPQSFVSDNGSAFTSHAFAQRLAQFEQVIHFAGAGAHHQNGNAERAIQTIMSISRTMMLHQAIHWPDVADATLWPMAVAHAVYLYNHVPNPTTGLSSHDLFTKTRWEQSKFHDLHVWGCPVYVLEKTISDGKKLPRWKPRSVRSINMGLSAHHASTVPLVLSPDSGAITAQFHVVFDDWFATVSTVADTLPDFHSPEWSQLFGDSVYQYPFDDDDLADSIDLTAPPTPTNADRVAHAMDQLEPPVPFRSAPPPVAPLPQFVIDAVPATATSTVPTSAPREPVVSAPREPVVSAPREPVMSPPREQAAVQQREIPATTVSTPSPNRTVPPPSQLRRSSRAVAPPERLISSGYYGSDDVEAPSISDLPCLVSDPAFSLVDFDTPLVYKATSDPDTLSFDEAMADADRIQWIESAHKEIKSLEENHTWKEVDVSEAKTKILPGTWVFRRKRTPDGLISKHKGRYCVRGDLQEGEFETYAPVVAFSTVRLFLVLSLTLNWYTCSIDFSNAFVQATLEEPVWIHLPRGFNSSRTGPGKTCLRLCRSLYGLSVAPKLWYEHLFAFFLADGFQQSEYDKCLLFKKDMLIIAYVDDSGIASVRKSDVDDLIKRLTDAGFKLTREGSFSEFLGIKFEKDSVANTITLTQKGLINKIIKVTGMVDCNPNWVPASQQCLGSDPDGEPMVEEWIYPSVVGMLLYLSGNTRPDIAFAVSQVARFNHAPKQSHATAIKMIVRYLSRTFDKGTIVRPTGTLRIDCWCDSDFCGLYRQEPDVNPISVKSRTGYIITLGGCPLIWKSQLQTEISLSTLESEYVCLSHTMRVLLPIRRMLIEVALVLELSSTLQATIHAEVFEDNNGALLLATNQRITSRTKYLLVKWHFFWSHINNGDAKVSKVPTELQDADYFTKGLPRESFERNRRRVQGW